MVNPSKKSAPDSGDGPVTMAGIEALLAGMMLSFEEQLEEKVAAAMALKLSESTPVAAAGVADTAAPVAVGGPIAEAHRRPYVTFPAEQSYDGSGDKREAQQFLSSLEAHYLANEEYYKSPDDPRRVLDARRALRGPALGWFDAVSSSDPSFVLSYSYFVSAFKAVYMLDLSLDRPLVRLRTTRMTKGVSVAAYTRQFNLRMGECASLQLPVLSYITDYLLGLDKEMQDRVEGSRIGNKTALKEWESLQEVQSTAVGLGGSAVVAAVSTPAVKVAAVGVGEAEGKGAWGSMRRKETEEERAQRMRDFKCEWCTKRGHVEKDCRGKVAGEPRAGKD